MRMLYCCQGLILIQRGSWSAYDHSMCALHPKENTAANGTRTAQRGGKCIERLPLRTHRQPIDEVAFRRELTDIRGRKAKTPAAPR